MIGGDRGLGGDFLWMGWMWLDSNSFSNVGDVVAHQARDDPKRGMTSTFSLSQNGLAFSQRR